MTIDRIYVLFYPLSTTFAIRRSLKYKIKSRRTSNALLQYLLKYYCSKTIALVFYKVVWRRVGGGVNVVNENK